MRLTADRLLIRVEELLAGGTIRRTAAQLRSERHPQAAVLAQSIAEWTNETYSDEEREWLKKILDIRSSLRKRSDKITISDFGAGIPSSSAGAEKRVRVNTISVQNSRSPVWLALMMKLIRMATPALVMELGTCIGISGMYCASALTMNQKGTLVTIEGAPAYAAIAAGNFAAASLKNIVQYTGRFSVVLPEILQKHHPIDFVFIDGHHDGEATVQYFEQLRPFLSPAAWLVFDDISWSAGMKHAWQTIAADKHIAFSADLSLVGICHYEHKV